MINNEIKVDLIPIIINIQSQQSTWGIW